jgi:hypothetical protein
VNEDRAREGVEHLQTAAIEVIAAVRAFLDVAEAVVRDPGAVATAASTLVDVARQAGGSSAATPTDPAGPSDEPRVTRIRVS